MNSKRNKGLAGKGAFEVAEEAFHLLRQAPARVLACYAIGTVPFVLGLLYFWADLSRSAYAADHAVAAALGMAVLFVWMKAWQAAFASELRACITDSPPPVWTWRRALRVAALQAAVQPYGLAGIPAALGIILPFASVYAFFQNVTVFGDGGPAGLRETAARAWRQAVIWPTQNHILIWLVCPWLLGLGLLVAFGGVWLAMVVTPGLSEASGVGWFLLGLILAFNLTLPVAPLGCVVAGNVAAVLVGGPLLWQILTRQETVFALSGLHGVVNTTFLTTVFGLTYLLLDPLAKAVYVLRCFYGEATTTGEDLRAAFRESRLPPAAGLASARGEPDALASTMSAFTCLAGRATASSPRRDCSVSVAAGPEALALPDGPRVHYALGLAAVSLVAWLAFFAVIDAIGSEPIVPVATAAQAAASSVTPARLDAALDDVLARPEYAWRMPRDRAKAAENSPSLWGEFLRRMADRTLAALKSVFRFVRKIARWFRHFFPEREASEPGDLAWQTHVQTFMFVLLALSASVLAVLVYRAWRRKRVPSRQVQAQPVVAAAALLNDEVTADQLPSDEWMALARDLLAKGETRLALRAMFLGALAHLAHAERLTVARFKSNRDYRAELERKAHDLPDVLAAFGQNVRLVERVWYGVHTATTEQIEAFAVNQARILTVRPLPVAVAPGGTA